MADGTFKSAPITSKQLYKIHGLKNGQSFPFAYCLVARKNEATYVKMIEELRKATINYF